MFRYNENGVLEVANEEALMRKINSCKFRHLNCINEKDDIIKEIVERFKSECREIRIVKKLQYFYRMHFIDYEELKAELSKRLKIVDSFDKLIEWNYTKKFRFIA